MEILFAAVLGVIGLWALWGLIRGFRTGGPALVGFGLIAASALVQILNITGQLATTYSLLLSIVTTLGLAGGIFLAMRGPAGVR